MIDAVFPAAASGHSLDVFPESLEANTSFSLLFDRRLGDRNFGMAFCCSFRVIDSLRVGSEASVRAHSDRKRRRGGRKVLSDE